MFAIIDAARGAMFLQLARTCSPETCSLFDGQAGAAMSHVAPHLLACDAAGRTARLVVGGRSPRDIGILLETDIQLSLLRKHLRRFLSVRRQVDGRRVFFRFYDPRVLRPFLSVCTPAEMAQFFGPIHTFHCQAEAPRRVLSFTRGPEGRLVTEERAVEDWLMLHCSGSCPAKGIETGDAAGS